MIKTAKKGLALLLALVLCLSSLSGIIPQAEAASYTYNWGAREDTADSADFTRSTAEEWYAKYNTSYEELAQLSGSKEQSGVPSSALYQELKTLMTKAHTSTTSYDGTKSMYQYTDCQNGGGKISSFYSGKEIGPAWGQGDWNREHTWPKSKSLNGNSNGGSDESDIMMLRPTSTSENSSRGNTAYGEYYYDPNEASGGKHDLHGDVARIVLYVYVRWGNTQYMWGASGVMESRYTLLKWMEEDPVDTWELGRNDAVQSITGTRNVFVDYPELGFIMFGEDVPAGYTSPSGSGNVTAYNITATSNNTSYGTVALSGKTITASPKTGYYASGYTVTSGSAQVIQNGNTFQVIPSSDCTIRINFAAKTSVQVKFSENGSITKTLNAYGGDSITLPSAEAPEGYTFLGWMESSLSDTTQKPTYLAAGTSVAAANKTYYALYTYAVGGTGVLEYVKKDITEIRAGDAFVITMTKGSTVYALPNTTNTTTGPTPTRLTAADGKLTGDVAGSLLWNLGGSANNWEFYPNGETSRWLCCISNNNGVRVGTESNKTFNISGTYLYNNGTGRYLGVYETKPDWRCYTNSSTNIGGQTLGFYVKSESGTAWYTTAADLCAHEDTGEGGAVAATCTQPGYTLGIYCNDCDSFISGHEVIPALGHAWSAWVETTKPTCDAAGVETSTCGNCGETKTQAVAATGHSYSTQVTPPTATEAGYTTYTCDTCGHSYVGNYTEALGESFTVSFRVPVGVTAVADMTCGKAGISLPTANAPAGYTFLGWSAEAIADTKELPEILTGTYTATANVTLRAVYSYTESDGDQVTGGYSLYTGELTEGDYVIYYKSDALKATSTGNNRISAETTTVSGNAIANPNKLIVWHIAPTADGNWTIYNAANKVYAASTGSKNTATLVSSVTDNAKWSVEGTDTYEFTNVVNKSKGVNALLRWNSTSIGWATYSGSTGGKLSLYKAQTGTTYYTTLECEHTYEAVVTPPTTEAGGYTTHTCTICGDSYVDSYTDPLPEVTLEIREQPQSITAETGATVTFTVVAEGAVSYKWQYRNPGVEKWSDTKLSGYNTDTLTITNISTGHHGRQYRCILTDAAGNTLESEPATLQVPYLKKDSATAFGVPVNTDHQFTVEYSITEGVTYQWQYKGNTSSSTWANTGLPGNKTNTLTVNAMSTRNGYQYRCIIKVNGQEIISKAAILYVASETAEITKQPVDASAVCGDYATFSIEATGEGLIYQWQWYHEETQTWVDTKIAGHHTNTLRVKTNNYNGDRQYRCRVRTVNGSGWNEVFSEAATMTVLPAAEVSLQPQNVTVEAGEAAVFTVEAEGEGLTYQWQWAKFVGSWMNTSASGATTDTLTITNVSKEMNGRYYRVIITNQYGGTYTTAYAQLTVE